MTLRGRPGVWPAEPQHQLEHEWQLCYAVWLRQCERIVLKKWSDSAGFGPSNLGWYLTAWSCIDLSDTHFIWTYWCPSLQSWNSISFWAEFIITELPLATRQRQSLGQPLGIIGGCLQTECDTQREMLLFIMIVVQVGVTWHFMHFRQVHVIHCDTSLRNALNFKFCTLYEWYEWCLFTCLSPWTFPSHPTKVTDFKSLAEVRMLSHRGELQTAVACGPKGEARVNGQPPGTTVAWVGAVEMASDSALAFLHVGAII